MKEARLHPNHGFLHLPFESIPHVHLRIHITLRFPQHNAQPTEGRFTSFFCGRGKTWCGAAHAGHIDSPFFTHPSCGKGFVCKLASFWVRTVSRRVGMGERGNPSVTSNYTSPPHNNHIYPTQPPTARFSQNSWLTIASARTEPRQSSNSNFIFLTIACVTMWSSLFIPSPLIEHPYASAQQPP